ncbi:hypothetical protein BD779DRAFT_1504905 [Infundibulicybe gibba]|nr:hypothetical protein BD779DRAFT_1504905 [Infundibulicybe gibba]
MDIDSTRVWSSIILPHNSNSPPLEHEPQSYNSSSIPPSNYIQQQMSADTLPRTHYSAEPLYGPGGPLSHGIPSHGPATTRWPIQYPPPPSTEVSTSSHISALPDKQPSPKSDMYYAPNAEELYNRAQDLTSPPSPGQDSSSSPGGAGANHYPSSSGVPRLPPILQVEKQQVTTSATQLASASRRRNQAHFVCPVPGCGSTFTRRFNLRGHLRSHTEERPYICEWPGCKKGFARQHDCKRHQALHSAKSQSNVCLGCKKTFSRLDALNVLRSDGGAECRALSQKMASESEHAREQALQ